MTMRKGINGNESRVEGREGLSRVEGREGLSSDVYGLGQASKVA